MARIRKFTLALHCDRDDDGTIDIDNLHELHDKLTFDEVNDLIIELMVIGISKTKIPVDTYLGSFAETVPDEFNRDMARTTVEGRRRRFTDAANGKEVR